jgi:hypothetical protein
MPSGSRRQCMLSVAFKADQEATVCKIPEGLDGSP